jgi:membrane protease YdiL (CAAX protease family)
MIHKIGKLIEVPSYERTLTEKTLNVWAVILILWSFYRATFQASLPPWIDEFIAKPLIFLLPVFYFISQTEKKSFFHRVDLDGKQMSKALMVGFSFGSLFLLVGGFTHYLKFHTFFSSDTNVTFFPVMSIIALSFATSFSEEIVSRGFVLKRLLEDSKGMVSAIFLSSLLFFLIHIPYLMTTSDIKGGDLIQVMVTDFLFSIVVSFLYLQRKNLWTAIIVHMCYAISLHLFM